MMVRGHFLRGYLRPDVVASILQGCLDDSYHVAPTVCQADDYPLRDQQRLSRAQRCVRPRTDRRGPTIPGSQIRSPFLGRPGLPIAIA
jgi:hypothetical protein